MKLNEEELINLINIVGTVSRPVASQEATYLQNLIQKMSKMLEELRLKRPVETEEGKVETKEKNK